MYSIFGPHSIPFLVHFLLVYLITLYSTFINPLDAKLNPICHLLALFGIHHILYVSR